MEQNCNKLEIEFSIVKLKSSFGLKQFCWVFFILAEHTSNLTIQFHFLQLNLRKQASGQRGRLIEEDAQKGPIQICENTLTACAQTVALSL